MTAQVGEKLIYEGEEMWMTSCPALPVGNPRLVQLSFEEARTNVASSVVFSTGCWRQYIGTWELKGGRLYLARVEGLYMLTGDEPLFAEWFGGVLIAPRGKVLKYVHMGFESLYEEELCFAIENGVLTKTWTVDNRGKSSRHEVEPTRPPGSWWQKLFGGKGS